MTASDVIRLIKEKQVKFADLRFTDTRGKEQHVTIPARLVDEEFFRDGKMFDGSSIAGWKGINESDIRTRWSWSCTTAADHGMTRPLPPRPALAAAESNRAARASSPRAQDSATSCNCPCIQRACPAVNSEPSAENTRAWPPLSGRGSQH